MDLERLGAAIRPRTRWEAMDLGVALARHWFGPLWLLWWCTAAPAALLTLPWLVGSPTLWVLLLWWLKPLFEAPLLAWSARALFGEHWSVARALRQWPASLPRRLWPYLLWRRLSPVRSFSMAVTLLEGQGGPARRARLRVLLAGHTGAGLLTLLCLHLEGLLWIGAWVGLALMIPAPLPAPGLLDALTGATPWLDWAGTLLSLLALSLVAPFYTVGGFALYLARRTELEAWDLELAFRRARTAPARRVAGSMLGVLLLGLLTTGSPGPALAAQPGPAPAHVGQRALTELTPAQAERLIQEVLAEPDFGRTEQRPTWVWIGPDPAADPDEPGLPDWLMGLLLRLAQGLKWGLLIALTALTALLLARLIDEWRGLPGRRPPSPRPAEPAVTVTAAVPNPLPVDIPAAVHRLLAAGDTRAALALLYQAQIRRLRGLGLAIPDSATEGDCLAAAQGAASPAERDWLARLTALWQRVAYAHQPVRADEVHDLLARHPQAAAAALATPT